jgi:hypothetical protein
MPCPGKIALLPAHLREELNRRLEKGLPGRILIAWLNGHPEAKEVLHRLFSGRPINAPNLTQWKQGAYAEWLIRRQIMEKGPHAPAAGNDPGSDGVCAGLLNRAAQILAARYLSALSPSPSAVSCPGGIGETALAELKQLHPLTRQITALRRSELKAARQKLPPSVCSMRRRLRPVKSRAGSPPSRISKTWSWNFGRRRPSRNTNLLPPSESP